MVPTNRKFQTAKTSSVSSMVTCKTVLVSGQFVLLCLAYFISYSATVGMVIGFFVSKSQKPSAAFKQCNYK